MQREGGLKWAAQCRLLVRGAWLPPHLYRGVEVGCGSSLFKSPVVCSDDSFRKSPPILSAQIFSCSLVVKISDANLCQAFHSLAPFFSLNVRVCFLLCVCVFLRVLWPVSDFVRAGKVNVNVMPPEMKEAHLAVKAAQKHAQRLAVRIA